MQTGFLTSRIRHSILPPLDKKKERGYYGHIN